MEAPVFCCCSCPLQRLWLGKCCPLHSNKRAKQKAQCLLHYDSHFKLLRQQIESFNLKINVVFLKCCQLKCQTASLVRSRRMTYQIGTWKETVTPSTSIKNNYIQNEYFAFYLLCLEKGLK